MVRRLYLYVSFSSLKLRGMEKWCKSADLLRMYQHSQPYSILNGKREKNESAIQVEILSLNQFDSKVNDTG